MPRRQSAKGSDATLNGAMIAAVSLGPASDADLEISDLQFLILATLRDSEKPLHGYAIYRAVERRNEALGVFHHVGQASIYKSLENLLRRGLIVPGNVSMGTTGHPAREFNLTTKGHEAIRYQRNRLERLVTL